MSGFSRTEYAIARLLARVPVLKKTLKYAWQQINYRLNKPDSPYDCMYPVRRLSDPVKNGFFGYYDISPVNKTGTHVIFHELDGTTERTDRADVILMDLGSGQKNKIGDTSMFNLQSGSRLQWLNEREVIYNKEDGTGIGCGTVRYDLSTGQSRFYRFPVFLATEHHAFSISLTSLRDVGNEYAYKKLESGIDGHSMISSFDWNTEETRILLTLEQLVSFGVRKYPSGSKHTVNHLMLSPDGQRLIFIHRWYSSAGKAERLLMIDLHSCSLKTLNDEMTSHCCWLEDDKVLGFMRHGGKDGYFILSVYGGFEQWNSVAGMNASDGHPSCSARQVVFDTYPDKSRMQSLYISKEDRAELVGRFFSPISFDPYYRCDLHPRLDRDASRVFIDSEHEGNRGLYMVQLKAHRPV